MKQVAWYFDRLGENGVDIGADIIKYEDGDPCYKAAHHRPVRTPVTASTGVSTESQHSLSGQLKLLNGLALGDWQICNGMDLDRLRQGSLPCCNGEAALAWRVSCHLYS